MLILRLSVLHMLNTYVMLLYTGIIEYMFITNAAYQVNNETYTEGPLFCNLTVGNPTWQSQIYQCQVTLQSKSLAVW